MKEFKHQNMWKCWVQGKWHDLLVLVGFRISHEWFLLRTIIKRHGIDEAESCLAEAICLSIKYGYSKRNYKRIREATQPPGKKEIPQ